ncbi:hypothetical protein [Phenylobacterium sp.]|uniref:hypothetical protein n=1 Tax=Phenylobacterium sp. TaxID=1871053 RepID=UPI00272F1FA6|nr:hypothetical protein [Phenylobacterium sp.]MDP1599004.1 hypothetical protein [Phenylobacterium sp.]MDP3590432.1 hypothetical protein [Phenylobacterium sp.]
MLQVLTGEDEHTAAEGPYARLLKTRKWLLIASAGAVLVHYKLYDPTAANALLRVISVPIWLLHTGLIFGLAYMLAQYLLLALQLRATYDIVLSERFADRRNENLNAAEKRVTDAQENVQHAIEQFSAAESSSDATRRALERKLNIARERSAASERDYDTMVANQPSNRSNYRALEVAIDAMRLGAPLIVAAGWLLVLLADRVGPSIHRLVTTISGV